MAWGETYKLSRRKKRPYNPTHPTPGDDSQGLAEYALASGASGSSGVTGISTWIGIPPLFSLLSSVGCPRIPRRLLKGPMHMERSSACLDGHPEGSRVATSRRILGRAWVGHGVIGRLHKNGPPPLSSKAHVGPPCLHQFDVRLREVRPSSTRSLNCLSESCNSL